MIWAIGASMIALAGLVFLPRAAVAAFALLLIAGHNLLDAPLRIRPRCLGPPSGTEAHPAPSTSGHAQSATEPLATFHVIANLTRLGIPLPHPQPSDLQLLDQEPFDASLLEREPLHGQPTDAQRANR